MVFAYINELDQVFDPVGELTDDGIDSEDEGEEGEEGKNVKPWAESNRTVVSENRLDEGWRTY